MRKVKEIEFNFENGDDIKIPLKHIGYFQLGNITRKIVNEFGSFFGEKIVADELAMSISGKANINHDFGWGEMKILDRMSCPKECSCGLAQIHVTFDDGTTESYFVPWGNDDHINTKQRVKFNVLGDLFFMVSEDSSRLDYFFPDELINADDNTADGGDEE